MIGLLALLEHQEDIELGIVDDAPAAVRPNPLPCAPKRDSGPRNPRYLAVVRRQPCCVCGSRRGVEAAHTGPRGLGQKAPDADAIPLCHGHHRTRNDSLHALGPRRFVEYHKIVISAIIRKLNWIGRKELADAHRPGRPEHSPEFVRLHCACGWRTAWYRSLLEAHTALDIHLEQKDAA